MASQAPTGNPPNVPDPFVPLQQLVSRIDSESRAQEVIDKATDLSAEEQQLLVDVLSTILNKSKILSQRHAHTWSALIKIASSARVFARNRTIRSEYIATGSDTSACIKVVRQIQDDTLAMCSEKLVEWAHLSHPNILPLYAVFLESEDSPSFVSLSPSTVKICDHAQGLISDQRLPLGIIDNLALWAHASHPNILPFHGVFHEILTESPQFCVVLPHLKNGILEDYTPTLPQKSRMLLISDVASGLAYLQNVMGRVLPAILTTKGVVISDEGRALVVSFEANYVFFQEKTYESWDAYTDHFYKPGPKDHFHSFGCLSYQVLSRKLPYYQVPDEQIKSKIFDVINGLHYLHDENVLISNEGRGLITDFGMSHINMAMVDTGTLSLTTLRFLAPETVLGNETPTKKFDIWSLGCLLYEILSRKPPYYQYKSEVQIIAALTRKEMPKRPGSIDDEYGWDDDIEEDYDAIDDQMWSLIVKCCAPEPEARPDIASVQELVVDMKICDDPQAVKDVPGANILRSRVNPNIDSTRVEELFNRIKEELVAPTRTGVLHWLLPELIQNRTKNVVMAVIELEHDGIQTIVNYLDKALKEGVLIAKKRSRVLAILSRITSSTLIFPEHYKLRGIKHGPRKYVAEGGCGTVYQGADPTICIKVMKRFDKGTLAAWAKEVILWAHSSHPNVLPFLGVFFDSQSDPPQTCLVSPFMKNGNLKDYAARLSQKSRLPLENVLISNEGHGLITDFGSSHINTATAATSSLSLTTLRFSAPETVLGNETPTKKFDIWSLGCLLYEVLSRKPPYYQYKWEIQIVSALIRKEMPKRPGSIDDNGAEKDEDDWDDDIEEDYDAIDDQVWSLTVECCAPEPEARPDIASVQELVVNMKIYDDRPAVKDAPGANILKSRVNPKIDLTRVEELFNEIKEKLAAHAKTESTDA
ncbi:Mitogen-activated protein kinase kinase kinase YODA [Leucoagaricus sp. SymC.cos]|nr:Mitogen-activated protein kinase kinase kinase YODA [Leucoagaricus sp. SymC.cos]